MLRVLLARESLAKEPPTKRLAPLARESLAKGPATKSFAPLARESLAKTTLAGDLLAKPRKRLAYRHASKGFPC